MYIEDEYSDYKYIIDVSDNYIILAKRQNISADWQNPITIPIIYKYINPSFLTIESTRTFTSSYNLKEIETSNSFYARADALDIIKVQFLIIFFIIFILNGLTRFVKKGGVFFGN